eukprot:351874-Chlamydomonas_euryale.AAC.5
MEGGPDTVLQRISASQAAERCPSEGGRSLPRWRAGLWRPHREMEGSPRGGGGQRAMDHGDGGRPAKEMEGSPNVVLRRIPEHHDGVVRIVHRARASAAKRYRRGQRTERPGTADSPAWPLPHEPSSHNTHETGFLFGPPKGL